MSKMIQTREQLAKITRAIAMSVDHGRLSDELAELGLTYEMNGTDATDELVNKYQFHIEGSDTDDEFGGDINLVVGLLEIWDQFYDIDVTKQQPAGIETGETK